MGIIKKGIIDIDTPIRVLTTNYYEEDRIQSSDEDNDCEVEELKAQLATLQLEKELEVEKEITIARKNMLKDAREEADIIIREAEVKALGVLSEAKENGYAEGYKKGYSEGKAKYDSLITEAENLIQKRQNDYQECLSSVENDIVEMVMAIARKFLFDKVNKDKNMVLELVKQSVLCCSSTDDITIRVSAQDYDYINNNKDKIASDANIYNNIRIIKEDDWDAGSCVIETPNGNVNSSLNIRLNRMERALMKLLG